MAIEFREFRMSDLDELARMADDTWFRQEYGPKKSFSMSYLYIFDVLRTQTSTLVAEDDGKILGVVSMRDHTRRSKKLITKKDVKTYARDVLQLDEAEELVQLYTIFGKINRDMVRECGLRHADEMLLLMVDISARGRGLGKKLFNKGLECLSGKKGRMGYVLTDSACNYIFYEKVGCEQRDHKTMDFGGKPLKMFLYTYQY